LVFLFFSGLFILSKSICPPEGVYISINNGSDITGNGTLINPFQNFGRALQLAQMKQQNESFICVFPGLYYFSDYFTIYGPFRNLQIFSTDENDYPILDTLVLSAQFYNTSTFSFGNFYINNVWLNTTSCNSIVIHDLSNGINGDFEITYDTTQFINLTNVNVTNVELTKPNYLDIPSQDPKIGNLFVTQSFLQFWQLNGYQITITNSTFQNYNGFFGIEIVSQIGFSILNCTFLNINTRVILQYNPILYSVYSNSSPIINFK